MFYYEMRILPVRMPGEVYQIVLGRWVRVNRREGTAMVTFGTLLPGSRKHRPKLWSEVLMTRRPMRLVRWGINELSVA